MTKDEILQALRLVAMGRTGHPLQEQLAERLADLLATPEQRGASEIAALDLANAAYQQGNFPALKEIGRQARARKKAD